MTRPRPAHPPLEQLFPPDATVPPGSTGVSSRIARVLAPNPGPMTLDGTNTWLLAEPGATRCVVVDPGPGDPVHLDAIEAALAERELQAGLIALTHRHPDHAAGAPELARRTGAPVRAADPAYRLGDAGLADGDVLALGGLEVRVVATPGHSSDSVSLLVAAEGVVLTGDHVLGRGTTVVAYPDGVLAEYLDSLRRLRDTCERAGVRRLLPAHGPVLDDPVGVLDYYLAHREERLDQVRAALAAGDTTVDQVVERVYADVDRKLWPAAALSVRAQLDHLVPGLAEQAGPSAYDDVLAAAREWAGGSGGAG